MSYNFQEFNPTKGRFSPLIGIGENGIGISTGFCKKFKVDNNNSSTAKLFWDKENNAIGILFSPNEGSLSVKFNSSGGAFIPAKQFFVTYDIDPKKYKKRKYKPEEILQDGNKIFVVSLEKPE